MRWSRLSRLPDNKCLVQWTLARDAYCWGTGGWSFTTYLFSLIVIMRQPLLNPIAMRSNYGASTNRSVAHWGNTCSILVPVSLKFFSRSPALLGLKFAGSRGVGVVMRGKYRTPPRNSFSNMCKGYYSSLSFRFVCWFIFSSFPTFSSRTIHACRGVVFSHCDSWRFWVCACLNFRRYHQRTRRPGRPM